MLSERQQHAAGELLRFLSSEDLMTLAQTVTKGQIETQTTSGKEISQHLKMGGQV